MENVDEQIYVKIATELLEPVQVKKKSYFAEIIPREFVRISNFKVRFSASRQNLKILFLPDFFLHTYDFRTMILAGDIFNYNLDLLISYFMKFVQSPYFIFQSYSTIDTVVIAAIVAMVRSIVIATISIVTIVTIQLQ